jgi:hypothetical protein
VQPSPGVTVINIADALEAVALRAALEWWNIEVTIRYMGAADQLVAMLDGSTALSPLVFLMCHGDERGMAIARTFARSEWHGDIGVATLAPWRHHGFATAAAAWRRWG